jgi:aminoglycoside 3-N-acetyltransferase
LMQTRDNNLSSPIHRLVTREEIVDGLRRLGVEPGQTLLVHASVSSIGVVDGGPPTVVSALIEAVGETGNVVVPTGTPENSDTSRAHKERIATMTADEIEAYCQDRQGFSKDSTPSTMGALGEALRNFAGAERSAHPQISFAALGPEARYLTDDHRLDCHLGEHSPLGKLYRLGASVLLLGVGYKVCTAFHLAEYDYKESPPRTKYSCAVIVDGKSEWIEYEDVVLDDTDFAEIGESLEGGKSDQSGAIGSSVRKGDVVNAPGRLIPMIQAVDYARKWMALNRA